MRDVTEEDRVNAAITVLCPSVAESTRVAVSKMLDDLGSATVSAATLYVLANAIGQHVAAHAADLESARGAMGQAIRVMQDIRSRMTAEGWAATH